MDLRRSGYGARPTRTRVATMVQRPVAQPEREGALLADTCEQLQSVFAELQILRERLQQHVELPSSPRPDVTQRLRRFGEHIPDDFKDRFVYQLLHNHLLNEASILRDAKILGMDLSQPRAVILIDASDYILQHNDNYGRQPTDELVRQRAQVIIRAVVGFFRLPSDTICAYLGDGTVAVLKASNSKNLAPWAEREPVQTAANLSWANLAALKRASVELRELLCNETGTSMVVGVGRHHPGVDGLSRSYGDAHVALDLGRRFHKPDGVYCLDSLGVTAFIGIADEGTKIDLATYLLSPLSTEPELLTTLTVFFKANCCPSVAAPALSIHRNTLSYRLDKIAALTGLDPRRFDDAVQIHLALLLNGVH